MTRRLPPEVLAKSGTLAPAFGFEHERTAAQIFKGAPAGQMQAALAALYRLRPEIGVASDAEWHERHMLMWPRDDRYFLRVCRLLKTYDVGTQWGDV